MNSGLDNKIKKPLKRLLEYKEWKVPDETVLEKDLRLPENFKACLDENVEKRKRSVILFGKAISKVVILVIILAVLGTMTIYAMCYKIFFYKANDKNTDVGLMTEEQTAGHEKIETVYEPTQLPKGYKLRDNVTEDTVSVHVYMDGEKEMSITQYIVSSTLNYDNEETQEVKIEVNGMEAVYFSKDGTQTLIWTEHGYIFELYTNDTISLDRIIHTAESLAPIE